MFFSKRIFLWVTALVGMLVAFRLPYFFPPHERVLSASYDYGFGNTVGILVLALFSVVFVAAGYKRSTRVARPFLETAPQVSGVPFRYLVLMSAVSGLVVAPLYYIAPDFGFGEASQFLAGIERVAIGQTPYKDFDFYYGPLLVYGGFGIFKLIGAVGGGFKAAYFIFLFCLQVLGLVELRFLINGIAMDAKRKKTLYWVAALCTLPLHTGVNLILFRFLTPLVGFLALRRAESSGSFTFCAVIAGFVLLTFGISIEYGVVFSVATVVYCIGSCLFGSSARYLFGLIAAAVAVLFFYMVFPGLFGTVALYLRGAWQWPFVPSVALVAFFTAIFVLAFNVGESLRKIKSDFYFLCFALLAFGSIPAALGRCDPGHLLLNGFGILFLAYFCLVSNSTVGMSRSFAWVAILAFGVLLNVSTLIGYSGAFAGNTFRTIKQKLSDTQLETLVDVGARLGRMDRKKILDKIDKQAVLESADYSGIFAGYDKVVAPYYPSMKLASYLRSSGKLSFLYFKDYGTLASEPEILWAIRDLNEKRPQFLLMPANWRDVVLKENYQPFIGLVFSTKFNHESARNGRTLFLPLVEHIADNYSVSKSFGDYVILQRKRSE